jgi:hypothetical protein
MIKILDLYQLQTVYILHLILGLYIDSLAIIAVYKQSSPTRMVLNTDRCFPNHGIFANCYSDTDNDWATLSMAELLN